MCQFHILYYPHLVIVFQDNQPMFLRTNLTDLNHRIHKYTLCYCLYMCFCCTVYCVAPLGSNIAGYTAAMADTASNSSISTTFAFTLYLEQGFYWLDNRTSLLGYCVCTVFMFPLMYLCAYTATVKVVAVFNMIKYCQTVLRIVVLKLRLLKTLPDVRQRSDGMSEVWVLHQRALRCAELLELVLQPLLLIGI